MDKTKTAEAARRRNRAKNALLEVKDICAFYGDAQALNEISMSVDNQEVVAVLGSNGAGKTTLLKTLTGILPPASGQIIFNGDAINGLGTHEIISKKISTVPEGRELVGPMSVADNLLLGTCSLSRKERRETYNNQLKKVFDTFPVLKDKLNHKAETMSGGEQQMLALGRALMSNPKLVVLDEPSLGVSPLLTSQMMNLLKQFSGEGLSILLVEQNARAALKIADYVYVLERGKVVLEGTNEEVSADPKFLSAYLGE